MRFKIKRFALLTLLEKPAQVIPTQELVPVLKNFQVEAKKGGLRVAATDLELSIIASASLVNVETPGKAVFPAKRLLDMVRESEETEVDVHVNGESSADINAGSCHWVLRLPKTEDYPDLPSLANGKVYEIDRDKFVDALVDVRWAAGRDPVRPNLMMVSVAGGRIRASDGARFQQIDATGWWPSGFDIEIPINAVKDLVKIMQATDSEKVAVAQTENHLVFQIGGDTFIATKLQPTFPDVESALLKPALQNNQTLSVDRDGLLSAVRRVRVTADPETSAIVLDLEPGKVVVRSQDKHGNLAEEALDAAWEKGTRTVAVNHQFLTGMLQGTSTPNVSLVFGSDTKTRKSPVLCRDDTTGSIAVISQMRADFVN